MCDIHRCLVLSPLEGQVMPFNAMTSSCRVSLRNLQKMLKDVFLEIICKLEEITYLNYQRKWRLFV